jgi:hypothetical protein
MNARARIHAMFTLDETAATELDTRLDAHHTEVLVEGAHLIEDAACDADWERPADYCAGLRAGAELLLAKAAGEATATAATPFFQPGHTYVREHHGDEVRFRVRYTDSSPCGTYRAAHGWRIEDWAANWSPSASDDFTGWTDVTEVGQAPALQHYDKVPDPLDGCHWCACGNRWPCKDAGEVTA